MGGSCVPTTAQVRGSRCQARGGSVCLGWSVVLEVWGVGRGTALGLPRPGGGGEGQAWTSRGVGVCAQGEEGVARSCSDLLLWDLVAPWLGLCASWHCPGPRGLGGAFPSSHLFQQRHSQRERAWSSIIYSEQEVAVTRMLVAAAGGWRGGSGYRGGSDGGGPVPIPSHPWREGVQEAAR